MLSKVNTTMETIHIDLPQLIDKLEQDEPVSDQERLFLKMLCIQAYLGRDEFNAAMEEAAQSIPHH